MPTQTDQTSFLDGTNATFIAELYARYLDNPLFFPSLSQTLAAFWDAAPD